MHVSNSFSYKDDNHSDRSSGVSKVSTETPFDLNNQVQIVNP